MGLLSPVLVPLTLFGRELWTQQSDCDQILLPTIQQRVKDLGESDTIRYFEVPRWIGNGPDGDIQLHIFNDTSKDAYCVAASLRFENIQVMQTALVFAK